MWLGTLLRFLAMLEIDGGVVRTAMSRLAADGWLARDKVGRKSFYRLAATGRERFELAVQHVYNPRSAAWDGRLDLLLIGNGTDREAARAALGRGRLRQPDARRLGGALRNGGAVGRGGCDPAGRRPPAARPGAG